MITKLKLKGNELLIFSIIHGFSQDGETYFKGSISYLSKWTGLDRSTIIDILKKLVDKGFIHKNEYEKNKVKYCEYISKYFDVLVILENKNTLNGVVGKSDWVVVGKSDGGVVGKSDPILIYNDNTTIDKEYTENEFSDTLFPEIEIEEKLRGTTEKTKCLFSNSRFSKFEDFEKCFKGDDYKSIDIYYYYQVVKDWSASKGRLQKDWIAQTRNIIRSDKEKNKLKLKVEYQTQKPKLSVSDAIDYLKNDY